MTVRDILNGNKEIAMEIIKLVYSRKLSLNKVRNIVEVLILNENDFDLNNPVVEFITPYQFSNEELDIISRTTKAHYSNEYSERGESIRENKEYTELTSVIENRITKYCF